MTQEAQARNEEKRRRRTCDVDVVVVPENVTPAVPHLLVQQLSRIELPLLLVRVGEALRGLQVADVETPVPKEAGLADLHEKRIVCVS